MSDNRAQALVLFSIGHMTESIPSKFIPLSKNGMMLVSKLFEPVFPTAAQLPPVQADAPARGSCGGRSHCAVTGAAGRDR